jgi:RND family efflux transporter MFP subunit
MSSKISIPSCVMAFALFLVLGQAMADTRQFPATGTVEPERRVILAVNTTGRVTEVNVDEGSTVRKGAVLVKIDDVELKADLLGAQADLELAQAEVAYARQASARMQDLKAKRSVSEDRVDEAVFKLAAAKAKLHSAQARVQKIEAQLAETQLIAPFAGTIIERTVEVGELTHPGKKLLVLENHNQLVLKVRVRESEVTLLRLEDVVTVKFDALKGTEVEGRVIRIVPSGDRSHTFPVEIALPRRNGLFPGMFGKALFRPSTDS